MAEEQIIIKAQKRLERMREINRKCEERKRRAAGIPAIGSLMACERCAAQVPRTNGAQKYCSECRKQVTLEQQRISRSKYNATHPRVKEAPEKLKERNRKYVERHPERRRASYLNYQRRKMRTDPAYALNLRISHAIWESLKGQKNGRPWEQLVGYSLADLVKHLERQFSKGMSWSNMGEWHVEHIIAKAHFAFTEITDPDFVACWSLSNLRPMWAKENLSKGKKRLLLI